MACKDIMMQEWSGKASPGKPLRPVAPPKPTLAEAAAGALSMILAIESGPLQPQQVAVLASGSVLLASWRFMSHRLSDFEHRGLSSLVEVWMVVAVSVGLGHLARAVARSTAVSGLVDGYSRSAAQLQQAGASGSRAAASAAPRKEGLEGRVVSPPASEEEEDEDDAGVQKRRAQAAAAAKLAEYQSQLQQLLSGIGKSGDVADDARLLYQLADQLFGSPMNVCELVNQGGVAVVLQAAGRALQGLAQEPNQPELLPVLLQVSWVLLQVAHGSPACCAALSNKAVATALLDATRTVMQSQSVHAEAKESILRNLCWSLLMLCDSTSNRGVSSSAAAAPGSSEVLSSSACAAVLHDAGVVEMLQQLISLQYGATPGWVSAATLGLFMQLPQQQPQQQQQQQLLVQQPQQPANAQQQQQAVLQAMSQAAVAAMLQPDSLHGVGYLLHHKPQLSDRLQGLVLGQLHFLLTFHTAELLQLLIEEHLVGPFTSGMPQKLGRLLVCQLLSSRGQETLAEIESSFELDVPLALAQVIPLPVHLKLPAAPTQQSQQHADPGLGMGELHPADEEEHHHQQQQQHEAQQAVQPADDVYTDILACRLLLQHRRLDELVAAFGGELLAASDEEPAAVAGSDAAGGAVPQQLSPVCDAVLQLVRHLMSRDLELQAVQHVRGDSIQDSQSSLGSSNTSSSSCIDVALAMPDTTGVYSSVLSGMVPAEELPAGSCSCAGDAAAGAGDGGRCGEQLLVLPALPASSSSDSQPAGCSDQHKGRSKQVVFRFGTLEHAVDRNMYRQIKHSSKLVSSILGREQPGPGRPVTLLTTPHFTPEANLWVLQCLERWLLTGALQGFSAAQACKLWVAADFLQVDGLQVACEDLMAATFAHDASQIEVALELCARHSASSSRLQRLAAQALMRALGVAGGGLQQLRGLVVQHRELLLSAVREEMRDRLVTLCMLNAGLDDDTPGEQVE